MERIDADILTSIVALPLLGALALLLGARRAQRIARARKRQRSRVARWCSRKPCCWPGSSTRRRRRTSSSSSAPGSRVRHQLPRRRRRHQPVLIVLTGFLTPIALLCSWESVHKKTRAFCMFVLALESAMIGVFVSIDLFLFYVFWDAMLIPMYFLIGIWGYERRIYAAVKFILYTMAGSVLMLLAIIGLAYH